MHFADLQVPIERILNNREETITKRLHNICQLLHDRIPHYDWVGFYFRNEDREELKLKTYVGEHTEHDIIPFGKGICGQVALSNKNFVVPDVQAQDNYIACSLTVKSEIVIPLFKNGENIGQIDIDSNVTDPFTEKDERFLEFVNQKVAEIL